MLPRACLDLLSLINQSVFVGGHGTLPTLHAPTFFFYEVHASCLCNRPDLPVLQFWCHIH